jgi:RNA polymerase sigma-70 factor (ECF subfamily)
VVHRDVADLDYAEIAAVLEIPVGTVKSRIARGRRILAERLRRDTSQVDRQSPRPIGNQAAPDERPTGPT